MNDVKLAITSALDRMGVLRSGQKMTAENTRTWANAIKNNLSAGEIDQAAEWFVEHSNFFPTPHEFIVQAEALRPPARTLRGWDIWGNTSGDWLNTDPDTAKQIHECCWNAHRCSSGGEMPAATERMLRMMGAI